MRRDELANTLNTWFEPARFQDAAENGLQIEGRDEIKRVITGVSANLALIDAAIEKKADAIFVHHGLVWGGGMRRIDGWLKKRIARLLTHDISLFAFHLPLDAHPVYGNNVGLADALTVTVEREPFGRYKGQAIGVKGTCAQPLTLDELVRHAKSTVGDALVVYGDTQRQIRTVGVCSGGAPDLIHDAIAENLDLYVTGEVTEWVKAVSDESGTAFLALGHHQTERFGARRIALALSELGLESEFVDVENPA